VFENGHQVRACIMHLYFSHFSVVLESFSETAAFRNEGEVLKNNCENIISFLAQMMNHDYEDIC